MNHLLFSLTLLLSQLPTQLLAEAKHGGFSVEIFHRDSKVSPFHNPSATKEELAVKAAVHSAARANHFASTLNGSKFESTLTVEGIRYLMKLSFGSPPVEAIGVIDTGSDLVWVQCQPCTQCAPQVLPIFDPAKSSTYNNLPCSSDYCQAIPDHKCGGTGECIYTYNYLSTAYTNGVVATDTMTLYSTAGQTFSYPNSVFGCGSNNTVHFHGNTVGIFGFSAGKPSLISQLGDKIQNRFSYCLLEISQSKTSKLKFGADAVASGPGVVSTPLIIRSPFIYYLMDLEAVTVGSQRIDYTLPRTGPGNIIIDSGSTLNLLEKSFYNKVEAAVRLSIPLGPVYPVTGYQLCYETSSFSKLPDLNVIFHFNGADVALKNYNTFLDTGRRTCFAMGPNDKLNIYGATAQINFEVTYDLVSNKLSFAPTDCSTV